MAVTIYDYITIISLILGSFSSILAVILYRERRKPEEISQVEPDSRIEVAAIVDEFTQRLKRIEQGLIDQRVKMEIMELRATRGAGTPSYMTPKPSEFLTRVSQPVEVKPVLHDQGVEPSLQVIKKPASTEVEILRLVSESHGRITPREIQQQIGKTREHTARMMNALYQGGLVARDVSVRPFVYSITPKGIELLKR